MNILLYGLTKKAFDNCLFFVKKHTKNKTIKISLAASQKDNSAKTPVSDTEAQSISQEDAAAEGEFDVITDMGLAAGADM